MKMGLQLVIGGSGSGKSYYMYKQLIDQAIACLPYGAIVGKVTLVDCVPIEQLYGGGLDTPRERAFGDWRPGRYGWILANPILFKAPIPTRGKQGLWEWTQEENKE